MFKKKSTKKEKFIKGDKIKMDLNRFEFTGTVSYKSGRVITKQNHDFQILYVTNKNRYDTTSSFRCLAWDEVTNQLKNISKGDKVLIIGRCRVRFTTKVERQKDPDLDERVSEVVIESIIKIK